MRPIEPYAARSLADPEMIEGRKRLLGEPHIAPMRDYAGALRKLGHGEVPEFDPLDGGIGARALFLFEKPGPMAAPNGRQQRLGSGFVSRDNNDDTAEATFNFMQTAGLPRRDVVIWNTIAWWNGTRKITATELRDMVGVLDDLLGLLPRLTAVVLVGKKAQRALPLIERRRQDLPIFSSAHPSPIVRASRRALWDDIPSEWARVCAHL